MKDPDSPPYEVGVDVADVQGDITTVVPIRGMKFFWNGKEVDLDVTDVSYEEKSIVVKGDFLDGAPSTTEITGQMRLVKQSVGAAILGLPKGHPVREQFQSHIEQLEAHLVADIKRQHGEVLERSYERELRHLSAELQAKTIPPLEELARLIGGAPREPGPREMTLEQTRAMLPPARNRREKRRDAALSRRKR